VKALQQLEFKLKSARRHPLQGLEVTGEDGVAYLTHTKRSVLEAGAVMFLQNYPDPCPHKTKFTLDGREYEMDGTDDPATLAVARKYEYGELESSKDWVDIPLD
jgi:hypothetical protein